MPYFEALVEVTDNGQRYTRNMTVEASDSFEARAKFNALGTMMGALSETSRRGNMYNWTATVEVDDRGQRYLRTMSVEATDMFEARIRLQAYGKIMGGVDQR